MGELRHPPEVVEEGRFPLEEEGVVGDCFHRTGLYWFGGRKIARGKFPSSLLLVWIRWLP